jgi:hypothetical protein
VDPQYNYSPNTLIKKEDDYIRSQLELLDHLDEIATAASIKNLKEAEDVLNQSIQHMEGRMKTEDVEEETTFLSDSQKLDRLLEQMARLNKKVAKQGEKIKELEDARRAKKTLSSLGEIKHESSEDEGTKGKPIDLTKLRPITFKEKKKSRGQHEKDVILEALDEALNNGLEEDHPTVVVLRDRIKEIILSEEYGWKQVESIQRIKALGIDPDEMNLYATHARIKQNQATKSNRGRNNNNYRGRNRKDKTRGNKDSKKE